MENYRSAMTFTFVLLLLGGFPDLCSSQITMETFFDEFDIFLGGVKLFKHNGTHPMFFAGKGQTDFLESGGNFRVNDYVTSRVPLQFVDVISRTLPFEIKVCKESFDETIDFVQFRVTEDADHALVLEITEVNGDYDRLWMRVVAEGEERVWGGGEQFSYLNLRGRAFPIWAREQGVGRNKSALTTFQADHRRDVSGGDYHTTPFPQPTYISSRGYYLHHEGPDYTILDFSNPEFHEIFVLAPRSNVGVGRLRVQNGSDVAELLGHMTGYLGRQPRLPDWIHSGAVLGVSGGTKLLEGRVQQARDHGIEVAAVYLEDWTGNITTPYGLRPFWNWQWNQQRYPDLPTVITKMTEKGIRVLGYVTPYLHNEGQLFQVADAQGYFVKNMTSNHTYLQDFGGFLAGIVDLTNPHAVQWYKNEVIKKNMIDLGLSGWMADFGEYLPVHNVFFHSGQSALELHNQWPLLWASLNREAVQEAGKEGDVVFWMRAGFSGSGNTSTLMWAGDQNVDWSLSDGLPSTIIAALSLALSGVTLTHFDIGGFTTFASFTPPLVRTEQLLLRSAEMAVFTPVFRTREGNQPEYNVQFYSSRGTLLKFARLSRMFARLKPYTSHVVNASSVTGLPAQRPLFLNYPNDPTCYDVTYQYMYGDDVMVAPVYVPDVESWDVYLPFDPEASWVFLWDELIVSGGGERVTVPAHLGHPPVFYRSSSAFISVFRLLAEEPLVSLPAYVPPRRVFPGSAFGGDCSGCLGLRSPQGCFLVAVLFALVLCLRW